MRKRHQRLPASKGTNVPVLPILVGVVLLGALAGFIIWGVKYSGSNSATLNTAPVANVKCDGSEHSSGPTAFHIHSHLEIIKDGQQLTIPAYVGIPGADQQTPQCFYWLHTHAATGTADGGVIHIEAPVSETKRTFTVGDFFAVWRQPLTRTNVDGVPIGKDQRVVAIVDGKDYSGDPAQIPLKAHSLITIEILTGDEQVVPQAKFDFQPNE